MTVCRHVAYRAYYCGLRFTEAYAYVCVMARFVVLMVIDNLFVITAHFAPDRL